MTEALAALPIAIASADAVQEGAILLGQPIAADFVQAGEDLVDAAIVFFLGALLPDAAPRGDRRAIDATGPASCAAPR